MSTQNRTGKKRKQNKTENGSNNVHWWPQQCMTFIYYFQFNCGYFYSDSLASPDESELKEPYRVWRKYTRRSDINDERLNERAAERQREEERKNEEKFKQSKQIECIEIKIRKPKYRGRCSFVLYVPTEWNEFSVLDVW